MSYKYQELVAYRRQLIRDAMDFKKPDRVPIASMIYNWAILEAGLSLNAAYEDPSLVVEAQKVQTQKYTFDLQNNPLQVAAMPKSMVKYTGPGYYGYHEETGIVDVAEAHALSPDEWDDYMADPNKYTWNVILPRKFENWDNVTVAQYVETAKEFKKWGACQNELHNYWYDECGMPKKGINDVKFQPGLDQLMNVYSGMKAVSVEMRRNPDHVEAFANYFNKPTLGKFDKLTANSIPERERYAMEIYGVILAHNFLNPKQFERFYWPMFDKVCNHMAEEDLKMFLLSEGQVLRFADYFSDLPKGVVAMAIENDDPYEFRKALPNVCICGGLNTSFMGSASPDECVEKTKALINDLGQDGGLILATNKMLSFLCDAKPENMKAVCDYVTQGQKN